jgi:hypothetical protein
MVRLKTAAFQARPTCAFNFVLRPTQRACDDDAEFCCREQQYGCGLMYWTQSKFCKSELIDSFLLRLQYSPYRRTNVGRTKEARLRRRADIIRTRRRWTNVSAGNLYAAIVSHMTIQTQRTFDDCKQHTFTPNTFDVSQMYPGVHPNCAPRAVHVCAPECIDSAEEHNSVHSPLAVLCTCRPL